MKKILAILAIVLLMSVSLSFAYEFVGPASNGWDWKKYDEDDKIRLINILYSFFDIMSSDFTAEDGVKSMNAFYSDLARTNQENPKKVDYGYKMSMRCSSVFGEILENSF